MQEKKSDVNCFFGLKRIITNSRLQCFFRLSGHAFPCMSALLFIITEPWYNGSAILNRKG